MAACRTRAAETWESTILLRFRPRFPPQDRKSTRLNSSHSLHDALPISTAVINGGFGIFYGGLQNEGGGNLGVNYPFTLSASIPAPRSEEHTSELQSLPTRRSSDLDGGDQRRLWYFLWRPAERGRRKPGSQLSFYAFGLDSRPKIGRAHV